MKQLAIILGLFAASFNSQALERLIVEFDGNVHKVVARYQIAEKPLLNVKHQLHKAHISWQGTQSKLVSAISIADPRIIRAPLAPTGPSQHEAILLAKTGSYVIDLPSNTDISSVQLMLPAIATQQQSAPEQVITLQLD